MRSCIAKVAICIFTALLFSLSMYGQCVPGMSPSQAAAGTWVFRLEGGSIGMGSLPTGILGSIGRIVLVAGNSSGTVTTGSETDNFNGAATTEQPIYGTYKVDSDCSGGSITLAGRANNAFTRLQFVLLNGFTEMYLLNIDPNGGGVFFGVAHKF